MLKGFLTESFFFGHKNRFPGLKIASQMMGRLSEKVMLRL